MKMYNFDMSNIKTGDWIEDSSFIGFYTYFTHETSYFVIDLDIYIRTKYEPESAVFTTYISPGKLVLKDFAHTDINIKTLYGRNNIQQDPFVVEKLKISEGDKKMLIFKLKLMGEGSLVIYATKGCLFIPKESVSVEGQVLYLPTEIRNKYVVKHFKDGFFKNKIYW